MAPHARQMMGMLHERFKAPCLNCAIGASIVLAPARPYKGACQRGHPLPQDERPRQRDRGGRSARQPARARAPARRAPSPRVRRSRFDQMMVLHDAKTAGTEAYVRIYNADGSEAEACGNGMRCVGWLVAQRDRAQGAEVRDQGRRARSRRSTASTASPSTWASRRFGWQRHPAGRAVPRHAHHRAADRADRQADPALAVGRQRRQPARGVLGRRTSTPTISAASARCWRTIRSFPSAPTSRWPMSPRRNAITLRTWERGAGLTKACGSAACAAAVCAARKRLTEPPGDRDAARRAARASSGAPTIASS